MRRLDNSIFTAKNTYYLEHMTKKCACQQGGEKKQYRVDADDAECYKETYLSRRSSALSHALKICVVGAGHWGKNYIRTLAEVGALGGIASLPTAERDALALQHGVPAISFEDALTPGRFQGLVIATPTQTHFSLAKAALEAGLDVLVEKPMTSTEDEAVALSALADTTGRLLMVGHLLLYHPAFQALRAWVQAGKLGELLYIYAIRQNLGRFYVHDSAFFDLAPHDLSMIMSLLSPATLTHIACQNTALTTHLPTDATLTTLAFSNGVKGHMFESRLAPLKEQKLVVMGRQGAAVFDDTAPWESKLTFLPGSVTFDDQNAAHLEQGPAEYAALDPLTPLEAQVRAFLKYIQTRETPISSAATCIQFMRPIWENA